MFWKVNYTIDDGYALHKRVCIINAESKKKAIEISSDEIYSKLKGKGIIVDKHTEITECENNTLLYNGCR